MARAVWDTRTFGLGQGVRGEHVVGVVVPALSAKQRVIVKVVYVTMILFGPVPLEHKSVDNKQAKLYA